MPKYNECSIYEEACRNGSCIHKIGIAATYGKDFQKVRVWRTASYSPIDGYFVWDIMEADLGGRPFNSFTKCRDGSYIIVQCYHFWTMQRAGEFLHDRSFDSYQNVEIVGVL
jgi:hypothetical protein